jgi:ABC-type sugar transport system ATPase subunit
MMNVDRSALDAGPGLALRVENVSKAFPGVRALGGVSFDLRVGEVHGLIGANGAGKSTFIRILSGAHAPDSGRIEVGGVPIDFDNPRQLRSAGIAAIYQELTIVPEMSVLSNVFLGAIPRRGPFTDKAQMERRYAELAAWMGVGIPAHARAGSLSVANQQMVEIMRAVQADHRVLIMDEPTAPLGPFERSKLYDLIGRLKAKGTAIIFISHDLDEVLRLCGRVSVMRDGNLVATGPAPEWTKETMVKSMLGDVRAPAPRTPGGDRGAALLKVAGLTIDGAASDISFTLHKGEVLGIAGLVGSGRTELLRALAGADPLAGGSMEVGGEAIPWPRTVRHAIKLGIALAPEDRKQQGLVLSQPSLSNLMLTDLAAVSVGPVVDTVRRAKRGRQLAAQVGFNSLRLGVDARLLSGGNQQKLVIGKWLHRPPRVLLLDEPTRGIDIGAKQEIFQTIRTLVDTGLAVILVSSDLEEVVEHADRVLVMARGRQVALLEHADASVERILNLIFAVEERPAELETFA